MARHGVSAFHAYVHNLRNWLLSLSGWRLRLALIALGALGALAFAPTYLVFLLPISFAGLLWVLAVAKTPGTAFRRGWWWGVGHFGVGLYWISIALLVEPERFAWLIPFSLIGFAVGMALFSALVGWASGWLVRWRFQHAALAMGFSVLWGLGEWLRMWVLTGFPWNLVGSVWAFSELTLQPVAWFGVLGLSVLTVLAASLFVTLGQTDDRVSATWGPPIVGMVLLAGVFAVGALRLADATDLMVENVQLRLVQPAIAQRDKWEMSRRHENVLDQLVMAIAPPASGKPAPTHIILAETAVPFFLAQDPLRLQLMGASTPRGGLMIAGAPRTTDPLRQLQGAPVEVWNSLHAVDDQGRVVATYDKAHLVPFGEYMPLRDWLPLKKITEGATDFSFGVGRVSLRLPGLPLASPLICYEVIFPGRVVDSDWHAGERPQWLLNITNDAWYGRSSGPYQHFAAARIRAVEEGLPMVRVANTGISAVVDGYGRIVAWLGLGERGVVDAPLPQPLASPTFFARWGHAVAFVMMAFFIGFAVFLRRVHLGLASN